MAIPIELDIDLTDTELYRSGFPHALFDELRQRGPVLGHAPMAPNERSQPTPFWVVVRHTEVQQANRDWATFSAIDGPGIEPSPSERRGHTIVTTDPTPHTRIRRLISAGFTPRMIGRLGDLVDRRVADVMDRAADLGTIDFVRDVAYPVPMHLIADIMGIPEADRPWVFERTDTLLRSGDPHSGLGPIDRNQAQTELFAYATELGEEKRRQPTDDVWSVLAAAEVVDDDGTVTTLRTYELDMFFLILSLAGSETTRNALSQGVMALVQHPDQLALLREEPALIDSAVEEILRWSSPVALFGRTATCDTELGGRAIGEGDRLTLWYPSANRDERVFAEPHRFDITRTPNPHVAFGGGGPHFCLGSNLAAPRDPHRVRAAAVAVRPHRDRGYPDVDGGRPGPERRRVHGSPSGEGVVASDVGSNHGERDLGHGTAGRQRRGRHVHPVNGDPAPLPGRAPDDRRRVGPSGPPRLATRSHQVQSEVVE